MNSKNNVSKLTFWVCFGNSYVSPGDDGRYRVALEASYDDSMELNFFNTHESFIG